MQIRYDPDEYETISTYHVCAFHQEMPGKTFAGCTCSCSTTQRLRTPEDIAAIKAERQRKEDDQILALAEIIKARRALSEQGEADEGACRD